ncbi:aspartate carbamoyltransferase, catalytic subunit [Tepidanaerobacter acetatoxydans Re1]|uniref:Aspartate carbamoyltransferase n=1 Tax=Tepidanaerobacter acetatoxydans (strain DSM 21804 / JCM 16047 / Re1) TaxID=1209989 RepID=F4LTX1_TEPAE|nr:aspartate carbamoyltransferase catalytic subunit [Tepidanaerobacter acetatoxydans]AEE92568.1 Aspartate carbamoyltransferase [Tepidanaerobacter acetatoxydans Re1]CCP27520.1 aspartate carbamoyltransferase, catalytic subunit [Tepidanaerobacter acetatoxydans Re1]
MLSEKHLLGLEHIKKSDIELILDTADSFKEILDRDVKKVPTLRGKSIVNLFYEPSTRTRTSFELAGKYLSADTINFTSSASSVQKGETLKDTAKTLEMMGIDAVVIRHSSSGAANYLCNHVKASVINAGDGTHEHPTQALLDMLTVRERKGTLSGLKVAIFGDILHSRVARSNIFGFTKMGSDVYVAGPSTLMPVDIEKTGAKLAATVEEAVENADVVIALRIQLERQKKGLFPTVREYCKFFGLNKEKLDLAKKDALLLHPGPVNRGIELTSEIIDGSQSVINEQVKSGVAVRMAVLYHLIGGSR